MSSEMIERIAKVLQPGYDDTGGCQCEGCRISRERENEVARLNARAVIEAMREPTDWMVNNTADVHDRILRDDCRYVWSAMIDAAVKGE